MSVPLFTDDYFMQKALDEAAEAFTLGEVPIGAVVVLGDRIIAKAHNQVETLQDISAHAELLALSAAQLHLGAKFLTEATLYVTIEPCVMCAGALRWARIGRVVWGAQEPKSGFGRFSTEILHPKTLTTAGVLAEECGALMTRFFAQKRALAHL